MQENNNIVYAFSVCPKCFKKLDFYTYRHDFLDDFLGNPIDDIIIDGIPAKKASREWHGADEKAIIEKFPVYKKAIRWL